MVGEKVGKDCRNVGRERGGEGETQDTEEENLTESHVNR